MYRCAIVFFIFASLVGCDGVYIYHYDGQLRTKDGKPIEGRWVAVDGAVQAPPPTDVPGPSDGDLNTCVQSGSHGQFQGAFTNMTGWIFGFRPSPPRLNSVRMLQFDGSVWHSSVIKLNAPEQTASNKDAEIHLGVIPTDSFPRQTGFKNPFQRGASR